MNKSAIYRFYDNQQNLLYIGVSIDPFVRFKQHIRSEKDWHGLVGAVRIEWIDNREIAEKLEEMYILAENPLFNISRGFSNKHKDAEISEYLFLKGRDDLLRDYCNFFNGEEK